MRLPAETRALLRDAGRAARARRDGPQIDQVVEAGEARVGELSDGSQGATIHRLRDAHRDDDRSGDRIVADHEVRLRPRLLLVPQVEPNDPGPGVSATWQGGIYRQREVDQTRDHPLGLSAHLSGPTAETPAEDPVTRVRDEFAPRGMSEEDWAAIRELTIALAAKAPEHGPGTTRKTMTVLAWYLHFCRAVACYQMDPEFLLRRDVIGTYIAHLKSKKAMTASTLGTYRSRLFRVADSNIGHLHPTHRMPGLRPSDPARPFSAQEVVSLRSWAAWQPSPRVRIEANVLLSAGLGGGLSAGEIIQLRARDVTIDDEGVLLHVTGERSRLVPLLAEWESPIVDMSRAAWKPDMFLFRPQRTTVGANVVYNMIHRSKGRPFQINSQRMRATWIVTHLRAGVPVQALLDASGIETLGALGRFYRHLPQVDAQEARSALTRRARTEGCRAPVNGHPKAVDE